MTSHLINLKDGKFIPAIGLGESFHSYRTPSPVGHCIASLALARVLSIQRWRRWPVDEMPMCTQMSARYQMARAVEKGCLRLNVNGDQPEPIPRNCNYHRESS